MPRTSGARLDQVLYGALALLVIALVALSALVASASFQLASAGRMLVEDFAPGVLGVHESSVALNRLDSTLRDAREAWREGRAVSLWDIEAARQRLNASVDVYLALPIDPGEGPLRNDIRLALARLDEEVDRTLAEAPRGPARAEATRASTRAALDQLDGALLRAARFNAALARRQGAIVQRASRALLPQAVGAAGAGVAAVAIAGVLGARARRRVAAAEARSRAVLERKTAELDAFAGRVSHDLLSPLTSVSLAVGLAERRLSPDGDNHARAAMLRAGRNIEQVTQLVRDLLEFARAGAVPVPGARANVGAALRNVTADFDGPASDAGITVVCEPGPPLYARCSEGVLMSIVGNLVQNAIKHLGDREERRVVVRAAAAGDEVRIEVEDTGPGVPESLRGSLFEPHIRGPTRAPGLGLGLATVKRLVESHGGRVGVDSEVGHGSLFWVTLPAG